MSKRSLIKLISGSVLFAGIIIAILSAQKPEAEDQKTSSWNVATEQSIFQPLEVVLSSQPPQMPGTTVTVYSADQLQDFLDDHDLSNALEAARVLIQHPNPDTREEAVLALDWIGLEALPDLARATHHTDTNVSVIAGDSLLVNLVELEDPKIRSELLWLALNAQNISIQNQAIQEAGFLPPAYGLPLLIEKLKTSQSEQQDQLLKNLYFLSGGFDFETYDDWKAWLNSSPDI